MRQLLSPEGAALAPSLLPDQLPAPRAIDGGSLLGFRTPLPEHTASADGKAAALLTILGIMFTLVAKFAGELESMLPGAWPGLGWLTVALLAGFAGVSLGTIVQAFRTLTPRFIKAPPSLAFFGDIARLTRQEYIQRVESIGPEAALEQILHYNYTVSLIVIEKFRQLRRAMRCFQWSFMLWLALMAMAVARMLWTH